MWYKHSIATSNYLYSQSINLVSIYVPAYESSLFTLFALREYTHTI